MSYSQLHSSLCKEQCLMSCYCFWGLVLLRSMNCTLYPKFHLFLFVPSSSEVYGPNLGLINRQIPKHLSTSLWNRPLRKWLLSIFVQTFLKSTKKQPTPQSLTYSFSDRAQIKPLKEPRNQFLAGRYDNRSWCTCPPGYIGWRKRFLGIDSWAP